MNKLSLLSQRKSAQKGVSFLEILIAVVILVTGILGAVALQAVAKKSSFDSMQRSLASSLAQDMVERMRGNDSTTIATYAAGSPYGDGDLAMGTNCAILANNCTPAQVAAYDLFEWEQSIIGSGTTDANGTNVGGLIDGVGCISVNGNRVTVTVSWQGRTELSDGGSVVRGDVNCGINIESDRRRQVLVNAFII